MPKVVPQMVALGLEHVVIVVCDLPAPTACVCNVCDVVRVQAMPGDKAVVRELCARCGTHDRDLEPMGRQGLVTITQTHVIDGPLPPHCREAAMPMAAFKHGHTVVGLPQRQALRERGMGVGLARQDALQALVQGERTQRLLAGESIAQSGRLMRRHHLGMCADPACARPLFAVLCGLASLRHDVLGGQGKACGASWTPDAGGEGWMIRECVAVRAWPGEAGGARKGLRRKGGGAIACDQPVIPKHAQGVEHAVRLKALADRHTHRLQVARRERSAPGAYDGMHLRYQVTR